MSIAGKLTVSAAVLLTVATMGATLAHADEKAPDNAPAVAQTEANTVDTTSEEAITEKAHRVINGFEADNKTVIPTGEDRVAYLKAQNFDPQKVQDKVNEILGHNTAEVAAPVEQVAQVEQAPVQEEYVEEAYVETPVQEAAPAQSSYVGDSSSAKEWIAQRESGGDYNASNGYHVGRYQLDPSYLNGDHSPANQERVADQYVAGRYGSWEAAQQFWMANGWY